MSDVAPPPTAEPPQNQGKPQRTQSQKLMQWLVGIALLISGGFGLLKGFQQFTLPSCASDTASATLKTIFKSQNVELIMISDIKSVIDTYWEKTCRAHVKALAEEADIAYRIYWDGWSARIMITKVN